MVNFQELSSKYQGLVKSEARRFAPSLANSGVDREDLEQEALIVLWEVSQKADSLDHAGQILKTEIRCKFTDLNRATHRKCRSNTQTVMVSEASTTETGLKIDFWERYYQRQPNTAYAMLVAKELREKIAVQLTEDERRTFDFIVEPDGELVQRAIGDRYERTPQKLKRPVVARALGISIRDLKKHEWRIQAVARKVLAA